jgi:DNA-binding NtrC family response regulator
MTKILIVDDDIRVRRMLKDVMEMQGYEVSEADDGASGLTVLMETAFDLVLSDIMMPVKDGLQMLGEAREAGIETPVIMLTAHASVERAIEAIRLGAQDFVEKPPSMQRLLVTVRNVLERGRLTKDNRRMRTTLQKMSADIPPFLGESKPMAAIRRILDRAAPSDARVLITGEPGTGKELVARWVHHLSKRCEAAFVAVNCAAIPPDLIESELFGHEKGSFTGAIKQHIGTFEQADGGTLFLDEIGDMAPAAQAKVLRVLQENKIKRVGGDRQIAVDVRVVAATNRDLNEATATGVFREDLFHRLSVIQIELPPLRDRADDISLIAAHFCSTISTRNGGQEKKFSPAALARLKTFAWRGNVRELHNAVERLIVLGEGQEITEEEVELFIRPGSAPEDSITGLVDEYSRIADFREAAEAAFLSRKLDAFGWNISKTSAAIELQRSNLYAKIRKYRIEKR